MNTKKKQDQKKSARKNRQNHEEKKQGRNPALDPGYEHEHIELRMTR